MRDDRMPRGAIVNQVLAMLARHATADFDATIVDRSPLGPRVLRVRGDDCGGLAAWLAQQGWVEAVANRPPHVYVRVTTEAAHVWTTSPAADRTPWTMTPARRCAAIVRGRIAAAAATASIEHYRETVVARSIGALLVSRGYSVTFEESSPRAAGTVAVMRMTDDDPPRLHREEIAVSGVDIPHGPLRARYGGKVTARDLMTEVYGAAPLTFILLRTERTRRIQLGEVKLRAGRALFESIAAERWHANAGGATREAAGAAAFANPAIRELAIELDLLPLVVRRAASELEPALVARYAANLTGCAQRARASLPETDAFWPIVRNAFDVTLASLGIDIARDDETRSPDRARVMKGVVS